MKLNSYLSQLTQVKELLYAHLFQLSIAIKALMCRNPNHDNKNMWFILDELPALQKVSSLPVALAESRKYGGCFVAGLQNIHQLEAIDFFRNWLR
ncbi:type IV secretory system Conjugative DNA transfer family protein [Orientia tsutsugamushi str. TA716]|uniref:Type IV secretory system Conjugative DNA transfer family protein n=1 Tax=Orientia tsutsugamushi str. TA716 TaxID=1359175 RepID=A0A0F3PCF6_ORITS|nr:type IV secretory system Conjugative DNA transfer family protein [Orientia tsutsugamushi str. TA716]